MLLLGLSLEAVKVVDLLFIGCQVDRVREESMRRDGVEALTELLMVDLEMERSKAERRGGRGRQDGDGDRDRDHHGWNVRRAVEVPSPD